MTYDNTDSNSDGVIDAPVDNDSVSTEDLNNTKVAHSLSEFRTLLSEGHSVVQLAPGDYTYSSSIDPSQNGDVDKIYWRGATLTQADGANVDTFVHNGDNNVKYEMFCGTVDGNRANNSSGRFMEIPTNFDNIQLRTPRCLDIPDDVIHLNGCYNIEVDTPRFRKFGGSGILFDGGNINDVLVSGGQIRGGFDENPVGTHAINIKNGTGIRLNCKTQATTSHVINIDWARGVHIIPRIEYAGPNGGFDGIHIDSTNGLTEGIQIYGGKFFNVDYAVNVVETGSNQTNNVEVVQGRVTGAGQDPAYRFNAGRNHRYNGITQPEIGTTFEASGILDTSRLTSSDDSLSNPDGGFGFGVVSTQPNKNYDGRVEYADGTDWDPIGKGRPTLALSQDGLWDQELEQSFLKEEGTQFVPSGGSRLVGPLSGAGERLIVNAWIESGSDGAEIEGRVTFDGSDQNAILYNTGSADCTAGYEVRQRR